MNSTLEVIQIRVPKLAANVIGSLVAVVLCAGLIVLTHSLPHYTSQMTMRHFTISMIYVFALAPVHEGLHALALLFFGKVAWRDIRFGMMWKALMPYCHCTVPVTVRAYRRVALAPLVVMSPVTFAWLLLYPTDWIGLVAGVTIAACFGDVWMVQKLRGFDERLLVRDCPSEPGCDILPAPPEASAMVSG